MKKSDIVETAIVLFMYTVVAVLYVGGLYWFMSFDSERMELGRNVNNAFARHLAELSDLAQRTRPVASDDAPPNIQSGRLWKFVIIDVPDKRVAPISDLPEQIRATDPSDVTAVVVFQYETGIPDWKMKSGEGTHNFYGTGSFTVYDWNSKRVLFKNTIRTASTTRHISDDKGAKDYHALKDELIRQLSNLASERKFDDCVRDASEICIGTS